MKKKKTYANTPFIWTGDRLEVNGEGCRAHGPSAGDYVILRFPTPTPSGNTVFTLSTNSVNLVGRKAFR